MQIDHIRLLLSPDKIGKWPPGQKKKLRAAFQKWIDAHPDAVRKTTEGKIKNVFLDQEYCQCNWDVLSVSIKMGAFFTISTVL